MELIAQYVIVLVNLDPTIGSEIQKTRPCVVISPNELNKHLQTIVVAPITSSFKSYPTRVQIKQNSRKGWVAIDQISTIDKRRIVKIFQLLSEAEIAQIKNVLWETFVS